MENLKSLLESKKYPALNEMEKNTLAAIMETTLKDTEQQIAEGTISGDVAQFTPFLLPMLRRIYPALIANELLGVQPMSGPTGFIYNLTNRYVGDQANPINPNVQAQVLDLNGAKSVGDTLTGATSGATGTIVYIEPAVHTYQNSKPGGTNPTGSQTFPNSVVNRCLVELDPGSAKFIAGEDVDGGTTSTTAVYSNEASWQAIMPNYSGSYTTAEGEIRGSVGNEMAEVGIAVERKQVEARTRKLRAEYTIEMYQDLKAMHGVLADQELMSLMGYEIKAETDREIVDFVNSFATPESDFVIDTSASGRSRWEIEDYRLFAAKLSDMSREIGRLNRRGAANKLLVSPKVLTMLEQIGGFNDSPVGSDVNPQAANKAVVGRFDNKFSVIVDNYAKGEYATLVYKGSNQDSMGVYAPYTPVQIQKVTHITTGQPALIAMTRYGLATNPWVDDAVSMGNSNPYAKSIGVDFTNSVIGA
jgi:hypothetical protein